MLVTIDAGRVAKSAQIYLLFFITFTLYQCTHFDHLVFVTCIFAPPHHCICVFRKVGSESREATISVGNESWRVKHSATDRSCSVNATLSPETLLSKMNCTANRQHGKSYSVN